MEEQQKRRGRPIVAPREGEKATLGVRATADLKRELQDAAKAAGRSLSEEASSRLERSFAEEHVLGGPRTAAVLRALGSLTLLHGRYSNEDAWLNDRLYFNEIIDKWTRFLEELRPPQSDDADQIRRDLQEYRELVSQASPSAAEMLRRRAREIATYAHLDPAERAAWSEIAGEAKTGEAQP